MPALLGIIFLGLLVVAAIWSVFWLEKWEIDFEGDAFTFRSSLPFRLLRYPVWKVPFQKIKKIEVYRPKSKVDQLLFLTAYTFGGGWLGTVADGYVIVETQSGDYVFSPPDPEGFAAELEARKADWLEGPKRGKWGLG